MITVDVNKEYEHMGKYDLGLVCLNGHVVNSTASSHPELNAQFCSQCGEPTISVCPDCQATIRGFFRVPGVVSMVAWKVPHHCYSCGKAYPWTQRQAEALQEVVDELEELSDEDREKLKQSIPNIVAETPKSETAALRFKKAAAKAGAAGGKVLMEVLAKVAVEGVKKSLGL
jgi:hypothetical protein